jgi:hypothetical protein
VVELVDGIDPERRRALVMKRAQALVAVGARAAQFGLGTDEVDHVDRVAHPLA